MRGWGAYPKRAGDIPDSHKKIDQGAIVAHNIHLGRCPKFWPLGTLVKLHNSYFSALEMDHRLDPFQKVGA